jgi:hypothetical protein
MLDKDIHLEKLEFRPSSLSVHKWGLRSRFAVLSRGRPARLQPLAWSAWTAWAGLKPSGNRLY